MDDDQLWQFAAPAIERFDDAAVAYDQYRPGYPAALFNDMAQRCHLGSESVVVEVGAGTGIASTELAGRCSTLVCLEPAAGMAALARANLEGSDNATVVEATFEAWSPTVTGVDVVCAANSWLWLDPSVRWAKAASMLKPGGHLALLAHDLKGYKPDGFAHRLAEVGGALNPALASTPEDLGLDSQDTWATRIEASGHFDTVETTRYPFSRQLDGPTFVAVLNTYGDNWALDPAARQELDHALIGLVENEFGGAVIKHEDAVLHTARLTR